MMICLAANSAEEALWREVAPRLRGTMIALWLDSQFLKSPEGCDAAAFIGPSRPDLGVIEHLLRAGRHVLLAADACLSSKVFETLFSAACQANVRLAVVDPDRYLPSRQLIRQQLDAGKLGGNRSPVFQKTGAADERSVVASLSPWKFRPALVVVSVTRASPSWSGVLPSWKRWPVI